MKPTRFVCAPQQSAMKFLLNVPNPHSVVADMIRLRRAKVKTRTVRTNVPPVNPISLSTTTGEVLPLYSNLLCLNCSRGFKSRCWGCPIAYHPHSKRFEAFAEQHNFDVSDEAGWYETEGVFCSTACVASYIDERSHRHRYRDSLTLLRALLVDITGECPIDLERAVPKHHRVEYGGEIQLSSESVVELESYESEKRPYMFVTRLQGKLK